MWRETTKNRIGISSRSLQPNPSRCSSRHSSNSSGRGQFAQSHHSAVSTLACCHKALHLIEGCPVKTPAGPRQLRLHVLEAGLELSVGSLQRGLGIDFQKARQIYDHEQDVSDLVFERETDANSRGRSLPLAVRASPLRVCRKRLRCPAIRIRHAPPSRKSGAPHEARAACSGMPSSRDRCSGVRSFSFLAFSWP